MPLLGCEAEPQARPCSPSTARGGDRHGGARVVRRHRGRSRLCARGTRRQPAADATSSAGSHDDGGSARRAVPARGADASASLKPSTGEVRKAISGKRSVPTRFQLAMHDAYRRWSARYGRESSKLATRVRFPSSAPRVVPVCLLEEFRKVVRGFGRIPIRVSIAEIEWLPGPPEVAGGHEASPRAGLRARQRVPSQGSVRG